MLKDIDIRKSLLKKISEQNAGHNYRIVEEMAICDGNARADIAVANGKLCGYEIKSDADTLDRLQSQQNYYNKTFDKITIVVGEKFSSAIEHHIPEHWGIFVAQENSKGKVIIKQKRRAKKNLGVEASALLELLWREEVESLLKSHSIRGISGKNRRILRQLALEQIPFSLIADYTREIIKSRLDWRQ